MLYKYFSFAKLGFTISTWSGLANFGGIIGFLAWISSTYPGVNLISSLTFFGKCGTLTALFFAGIFLLTYGSGFFEPIMALPYTCLNSGLLSPL